MKGGREGPPRKARRGKGYPGRGRKDQEEPPDKRDFSRSAGCGSDRARARPQLGGPAPAPPPDLPGSAGVPPAFCPGQRFRPCQRLRTRVQTGNILYTINRNMVYTLPRYRARSLVHPKITPPWRGSRRDRGGARGRAGGGGPPAPKPVKVRYREKRTGCKPSCSSCPSMFPDEANRFWPSITRRPQTSEHIRPPGPGC